MNTLGQVLLKLKLSNSQVVAQWCQFKNDGFDRVSIYFRTASGKPKYYPTKKQDGWDIIHILAKENNITATELCDKYKPQIFDNRVTFWDFKV